MNFLLRIAKVQSHLIEGESLETVSAGVQAMMTRHHGTPNEFILLSLEPAPAEEPEATQPPPLQAA